MSHVPGWWALLLLALASFRSWRILGVDTVLDPLRDRLVRDGTEYRQELDEFLHCPWCLGWWVSVVWWLAWLAFPHATLVVAVPFAISAGVGLVAKAGSD